MYMYMFSYILVTTLFVRLPSSNLPVTGERIEPPTTPPESETQPGELFTTLNESSMIKLLMCG